MDAESVIQTFQTYMGSSLLPVLFFLALLYLYWTRGVKEKRSLVRVVLLLLLFVFNDVIFTLFRKMGMGEEYYRFFWLLPVVPVLACALTEISGRASAKWKKFVWGIAVAGILLGGGSSYLRAEDWMLPENKYGISQDVLEIATILENVKETERPVVAFDYELNLEIRQYDASIVCALSREEYMTLSDTDYVAKEESYEDAAGLMRVLNQGIHEDKAFISSVLEKRGIEYLAVKSAFCLDKYLGKIGCREIGRSSHYTLYRVYVGQE